MGFDDSTRERFWSKVDKRSDTECWPWMGFCWPRGYGCFWMDGRSWRANRVALLLSEGDKPDKIACHRCANPRCCNPNHLYWGTVAENMRDILSHFPESPHFSTQFKTGVSKKVAVPFTLSDSQVGYMKLLMAAGYPNTQLAEWYGCSRQQVSNIKTGKARIEVPIAILRQFTLDCQPLPRPHKYRAIKTKLDAEKVREIRNHYASGLSCYRIGEMYGVANQTISKVVNRQLWSYVD